MKNKLVTLILVMIFIFTPFVASAQVPFGGRIVMTHECLCSGGWMMYIWDQYTGAVIPVLFQFGVSRLNGNYNIYTPGVQTLGSYYTGGICLMVATECAGGPTPIGTVTSFPFSGIGTSLLN